MNCCSLAMLFVLSLNVDTAKSNDSGQALVVEILSIKSQ